MIDSILEAVASGRGVDRGELSYETHNGANFVTVTIYHSEKRFVICRFARDSEADLVREYGNLRRIASLTVQDGLLRQTTERVVTVRPVGGKPVLTTTVLPGIKAGNLPSYSELTLRKFLGSSTQWLCRLVDVTEPSRTYDRSTKRSRLMTMTGSDDCDALAHFVENDELFLAPMHGDFAPGNILIGNEGRLCGVIDFEWFDVHGVPLFDFVHLVVTTGAMMFDKASTIVEGTLFEENALTRTIADCARIFRRRIGISASTFRRILPLYAAVRSDWGHQLPPFQKVFQRALGERVQEVRWA